MNAWVGPGCVALCILCALLTACTRLTAVLPSDVPRCTIDFSTNIRNRAPAGIDAADCVLYWVEGGVLYWRSLHPNASGEYLQGVLVDSVTVTDVAVGGEEIFFLYDTPKQTSAVGRIDAKGRVTLDAIAHLPAEAYRLYLSADELFCADDGGQCWRLSPREPAQALAVGRIWALTHDALIFAEGNELRALLRKDYATVTAIASLPGGAAITALAVDQATEEETRIYVLAADGQIASFADGAWTLHGAPMPDASAERFAVLGNGCAVADSESVWYIDAANALRRLTDACTFAIIEDKLYPLMYTGEGIAP